MKLPNIISGPIKDGNTEDSVQFKKSKNPLFKNLRFLNKGFFI